MTDRKLNNIDTLRGMHGDMVKEIIERYKNTSLDSIGINDDDKRKLMTIAERYYSKLEYKYRLTMIYKCLYWFLYMKNRRIG